MFSTAEGERKSPKQPESRHLELLIKQVGAYRKMVMLNSVQWRTMQIATKSAGLSDWVYFHWKINVALIKVFRPREAIGNQLENSYIVVRGKVDCLKMEKVR